MRRRKTRRQLHFEKLARQRLADRVLAEDEVEFKTRGGRLVVRKEPKGWRFTHYGCNRPARPSGRRTFYREARDLAEYVVRIAGAL